MEVRTELPKVFEEFAEQRRKSFMTVKDIKDKGIPVVGAYCTYFPKELAMAFGAVPVSLCSTSDETIPAAEKDLPKNLCPLIKSSYGFAITDKCPYFYFSDLVIGETTCDGKKKMYELMGEIKDVFLMELPNSQKETGFELWKSEVMRLKKYMEDKFQITITDEMVKKAIHTENEVRKSLKRFYELMKLDPVPVTGHEIFKVLYGSGFKFDREKLPAEIDALTDRILKEYEEGKKLEKKPRILITGCPIGGATEKVIKAIEENGAVVVAYENCVGSKVVDGIIDESASDIYDSMARRYFDIGCSVMAPNPNRIKSLDRIIDEFKVDGVVEMVLQACHTYAIESREIRKFVQDKKGKPYLNVETDYSSTDVGQLNTRIGAFIEML